MLQPIILLEICYQYNIKVSCIVHGIPGLWERNRGRYSLTHSFLRSSSDRLIFMRPFSSLRNPNLGKSIADVLQNPHQRDEVMLNAATMMSWLGGHWFEQGTRRLRSEIQTMAFRTFTRHSLEKWTLLPRKEVKTTFRGGKTDSSSMF